MLAHASAHSATFDDNATGTVFSVSVVAYQWGWNYYFPRELVDLFAAAPKQVGRGHTLETASQLPYARLLEQWRADMSENALKSSEVGMLPGLVSTATIGDRSTVGSRLTRIYRSLTSIPSLSISGGETVRILRLLGRLSLLQGSTHLPVFPALNDQGFARLRGAARALTNTPAPVVGTRSSLSVVDSVELGLPSLDVSQLGKSGLGAILPLPTLDLDPTATLGKWAGELTTTRQSDYTTKFWTLWGPALRGVSGPAASSPSAVWLGAWGLQSTGVTSASVARSSAPAMRAEQLTALSAQPIRG